MTRAGAVWAIVLAACGGDGGGGADVDARPSVDAKAACVDPTTVLGVLREPAGATRIYARVSVDGADALLLIDTGSQYTFVSRPGLPDGTPDAAVVHIGCEDRSVIGRPFELAERYEDEPVVGFLGADYFLDRRRELDLAAGTLVDVGDDDDTHTAWPALSFDASLGYLFVALTIDGTAASMGFDTGASDTLWLRHEIEPGDVEVQTQDAYGNALTLGLGREEITAGTWPTRTLPVLHAPSFPSLEDSNEAIGRPELAGLVGLTSLPGDRVRIDAPRGAIYVAP